MASSPMKKTAKAEEKVRRIVDPEFSHRINTACDTNPQVPAYNYGRLTWVRDQLLKLHDLDVSLETVRKWFAGEARPRPDKMRTLAELLAVDQAWLSLGITPEMQPTEKKAFQNSSDGAVNLVAGLIQLHGGHPAAPEPNRIRTKNANLMAIITGRLHAIHVALGREDHDAIIFKLPPDLSDLCVLAVVTHGGFKFDILHMHPDHLVKVVTNMGGYSELVVRRSGSDYTTKRHVWQRVRSFSEPL